MVFAGNDVALLGRDGGYQSFGGEEGIGVSADDELGSGNRPPTLACNTGDHRGNGNEGCRAGGLGGESDDHLGAEGVAGEGETVGINTIDGGEERDSGLQVFEFATAIVVGTFAAAYTTEVEPEGRDSEPGQLLCEGHDHPVVHVAAVLGVGVGYDNRGSGAGLSLGRQSEDAFKGQGAGREGDIISVHVVFRRARVGDMI